MAVFKRLYTLGFPTRQRELVLEMQEWFIANSPTGEAPTKARSGAYPGDLARAEGGIKTRRGGALSGASPK